jgi:hypothetical protein
MFKKTLVDLHAEIDMPRSWYYGRDLEQQAKYLEDDAKELTAFIRDHRSRDQYGITIVREYKTLCEFCGREEERHTDTDEPLCCQKAIDEFNANKTEATK